MYLDLIIVGLFGMSALMGWCGGGLTDVLNVLVLVVAYFASAPLAGPLARAFVAWTPLQAGAATLAGRAAAFLAVGLVLAPPLFWLGNRMGRGRWGEPRWWNKWLGLSVGAVWGLALCAVVLFGLDAYLKVVPYREGWLVNNARASLLRTVASRYNPADKFLVTDVLRALLAIRREPALAQRLRDHPQIRRLLNHPRVRMVMTDQELRAALRAGQVLQAMRNPALQGLLTDRNLRAELLSQHTREALRSIVEEGPPLLPAQEQERPSATGSQSQ